MARYSLFVFKVALNAIQPANLNDWSSSTMYTIMTMCTGHRVQAMTSGLRGEEPRPFSM